MTTKVSTVLNEIAIENDWKFSSNYSGKYMFGRTCLSITSDYQSSPVKIIEEAAAHGIFGASWDSMGMGVVVYWPAITGETEMDRMVLVDEDDLNEE